MKFFFGTAFGLILTGEGRNAIISFFQWLVYAIETTHSYFMTLAENIR